LSEPACDTDKLKAPAREKLGACMKQLILVVDDEVAFCEVVCEILESAGYRAQRALHVNEALQFLDQEYPDLILTDVMMPDIDGLTFIRKLKENPDYATIPAVVVSACTTPEDTQKALQSGAVEVLPKPFSSEDLETLVRSLLP
jgi:CheY-like chemotaxis protein